MHMRKHWYFIGGVTLLVLAIYGRSLFNDFVLWDDNLLVLENSISHGLSFENIGKAFTTYDPDLYVPLTFISFQINYLIGGLHPFIYHLTNVLLHTGSTILVGWVVLLLAGRSSPPRSEGWLSKKKSVAVFTALLFAVHPINVEAVAWVSARKDLLSGFFFLLSLGCFLRFRENGRRNWYGLSVGCFLLGLLSKVSILGLPFILLLCDWYQGRRITKRTLIETAPFFLLSISFGIASIFGKMGGSQTMFAKLLVGAKATVFSLLHLVIPVGYSVVYPFTGEALILRIDLLLPLIAVIAVSIAVTFKRKRFPAVCFGWWWFMVMIAPSFLTAAKGKDVISALYVTSDRYVYLASVSVFLVAALLLEWIPGLTSRVRLVTIAVIVIILGNLSAMQSMVWKNTDALLSHTLAIYPDSEIAHNNLGAYYDSLGKHDLAAREYTAAVESGGTSDAWFNVGVTAMQEKRTKDAITAFTKAVEMRPGFAIAQINLGALLIDTGRLQEAVDHLLIAQTVDPGNVAVYLNLGVALEKSGNITDAVSAYEWALKVDPGNSFAQQKLAALRK